MYATIHMVYSYPESYEVTGYIIDYPYYKSFIMAINKETREIEKFQYLSSIQQTSIQNYIYECCLYTIDHNLIKIRNIRNQVAQ